MDIEDIKQLIPDDGEKIILMENGKPIVVLMSFNTYKNKFKSKEKNIKIAESDIGVRKKTKKELTIEDLPF